MGDKAVKGMDVGHKDNNPLNNDPKNLRNEDPSKNRREPRLRENYLLEEVDIGNWKYEGPKEFAMKLMDKFGPPEYVEKNPETNEGYAVVFKNIDGFDFVRIVDSNTNKLHPYPAKIYVEGGLYFKVPHEMVGKLKLASPTIMIDELNGWVVGKCASLTIAAATLQFVIDAVNGDAPPTREEYDKRIRKIIEDGKVFPEITWWNNELKESKAPDTSDAMKRYEAGKAGFTDIAHLKAKGLIKRSDGTKKKSPKYEEMQKEDIDITGLRTQLVKKMFSKQKYDVHHSNFSSVIQHIADMAKTLYGITIDPKTVTDTAKNKIKPKAGVTKKFSLKGDKGSVKAFIYNRGGLDNPFELRMYQEDLDESLWANIHKKRQRIKQGSGEKMRKKGEKGAPTPAQM